MHTAHAESSAKVDEREREREGARAKTRARARWTYFRVTPSLFLTRTRRRTVASARRRVLGDRAATRQWFTIVRRGAFGGDEARLIRGSIGGVVLVAIVLVVVTIRDVWFASAPSSDGRFPSSRKRWRAARSASAHAKTSARARKRIPRFRFDLGARDITGIGEKAPHSGASSKTFSRQRTEKKWASKR